MIIMILLVILGAVWAFLCYEENYRGYSIYFFITQVVLVVMYLAFHSGYAQDKVFGRSSLEEREVLFFTPYQDGVVVLVRDEKGPRLLKRTEARELYEQARKQEQEGGTIVLKKGPQGGEYEVLKVEPYPEKQSGG